MHFETRRKKCSILRASSARFASSAAGSRTKIENKGGKLEIEDGVVPAIVETWRCS